MREPHGLEYETSGDGEPVLLVHGSHVAGSFLPLAREPVLADRYRLIRYHRRGFAGSDRLSRPFGIAEQAQDALALLDHLAVDAAHVVGHSYGGLIAIQLAFDAPRAVRSLLVLEPPLLTPEASAAFSGQMAPLLEAYRRGDAQAAVDGFMSTVCGPDWQREASTAVPGAAEQAVRDAATFFEFELPALTQWSFDTERARRILQPALFVLGAESGPLFEAPRALFRGAVSQAEEAVLPGLNHLLHIRNPRLVAETVTEFLGRHPL
jgi:3-oxoadipate enol-lactonase